MSSYFSVINDNGITTIDDNNQTLGVYREGNIRANISKGDIYGFSVGAGESVGFRPDKDTKFICSPPVIYGGNLLYFVATTDDTNIRYRVYKKVSLQGEPSAGIGLVLFNEQGKTVFNSSTRTWSHNGFYQGKFPFGGSDWSASDYASIVHHFGWTKTETPFFLNFETQGSTVISISLEKGSYLNPLSSPWFTDLSLSPRSDRRFTTLGYIFERDVLKTERYFEEWCTPQRLIGSGSMDVLFFSRYYPVQTGIQSFSYMFNIVE